MLKNIILSFLLLSSISHAQYSIKGELNSTEDFPYMILYKLQGITTQYVAYDTIVNRKFSIAVPPKENEGIYRMVYDVPNKLFVDIIYAKENIAFSFDPKNPNQSIRFIASDNNRLYYAYLNEVQKLQQQLDSLQIAYFKNASKETEQIYTNIYAELIAVQSKYEKLATDKLAFHFIEASARFNNKLPIKTTENYFKSTQNHFFDYIKFNSKELAQSTFIFDKINDYIFFLNSSDDLEQLKLLRRTAIRTVLDKIGSNHVLAKDINESLLSSFAQQEDIDMVNFVLNQYFQLPREYQDSNYVIDIKGQLKTAIGMKVPNLQWQENNTSKDLHSLTGATNYVVVFWSSTCSHCLKEMPVLYDYLKDNTETKVIAVGLEDAASKGGWEAMIGNYKKFSHVYGKDKWKNTFARDYGVNATPSFYVLDANKKVVSKPNDVAALKKYFSNN